MGGQLEFTKSTSNPEYLPSNGLSSLVIGDGDVFGVHLEQMRSCEKTGRVVGIPPCLTAKGGKELITIGIDIGSG